MKLVKNINIGLNYKPFIIAELSEIIISLFLELTN